MSLNIRGIQVPDVAAVAAIAAKIMPFAWSEKVFLSCVTESYLNFVLEEKEKIIGFCVSKVEADETWLLNIGIAKDCQRRGLGHFLLEHVLLQSTYPWWLEVRASNLAAIQLYKQLGFIEVSRRKGYYPGIEKREDAVVMRRV